MAITGRVDDCTDPLGEAECVIYPTRVCVPSDAMSPSPYFRPRTLAKSACAGVRCGGRRFVPVAATTGSTARSLFPAPGMKQRFLHLLAVFS